MSTWDSYISTHSSYKPTAMNNVTRNTGINFTYPWTTMLVTLHTYAPMYLYSSLHTVSMLLPIFVKKIIHCNFYCHTIVIYVPTRNMPLQTTCANYFTCIYETTISVQTPHMNAMQWTMWHEALVYIHFTLLPHGCEKICLLYCTYMFNCPATLVCM